MTTNHDIRAGLDIAVIGMAGQFPGAKNITEFWENLKNGRESISFFSDPELEKAGISPEILENPDYVKAKGIIEDIEFFDASFFGYTPGEAHKLDPQIRIFHQMVWQVLEDAGYDPDSYEGSIGLYAGASNNTAWEVMALADDPEHFISIQFTDKDQMSTRISYKLNLTGPSFTLETQCSTSLVAFHLACQGLLCGECEMALAGGISITLPVKNGYFYQDGMLFSRDGHIKAFDKDANGTVFGNAVGIVLLKRIEDAIDSRDHIYAVVKGTAINNDGNKKISYSAPSVEGQAEVIRTAQGIAQVKPESITYVETHGTGTSLGDPIEIEALKLAFDTTKKGFCRIGSVKSNLGHLDNAAGITSLIKTILAIKHRLIPPSIHFNVSNPKIDFEDSPFLVNTRLYPWKNNVYPLRAGVSSFGIGGTNAHVVLEEWMEDTTQITDEREFQLFLLSAKTQSALETMTENLANHLKKNPGINLADTAYTLQLGRQTFQHRRMLVVSNVDETTAALSSNDPGKIRDYTVKTGEKSIIFMFPGQGSQYVNMALGLYKTEPVFAEEMDRCFDLLKSIMEVDIKEILYPGDLESEEIPERLNSSDRSNRSYNTHMSKINQTEIAQPVLFVIQYSLAKLLMHRGIKPSAMVGHSIGEYVAACLSGVFSLEEGLKVVAWRGKLMQKMPAGSMLSVSLSEQETKLLLQQYQEVALAAVNAPSLSVVSGPDQPLDTLEHQLKSSGHDCRRLHTSHAFHSSMMDPILEQFEHKVKEISLNKPQLPYISNITGNWITDEEAASPGYWAKHLRSTVRFADGISLLSNQPDPVFIELGPGRSLSTLVNKHTSKTPKHKVINLIRHPGEEVADDCYLLNKIGQLWLYGQTIDWNALHSGEQRRRLHLPTYPFEKQTFPTALALPDELMRDQQPEPEQDLIKRADMSQWFYTPSWRRTILGPVDDNGLELVWLVFIHQGEKIGNQLLNRLKQGKHHVIVVFPGDLFNRQETGVYTINPRSPGDYDALVKSLAVAGTPSHRILHAWNIGEVQEPRGSGAQWDDGFLYLGFYSLVFLAQAIGRNLEDEKVQITVLTNNMQDVTGEEVYCPHRATVLGPVMIIPREYPNIRCRSIDVLLPPHGSEKETLLIQKLITECTSEVRDLGSNTQIALRGNHRYTRQFDQVLLEKPGELGEQLRLSQKGVYLITGGLGGIGLVLARYLAQKYSARLVLTGRSQIPPGEKWENWLNTHPGDHSISQKINSIRELESLGAQVMVFSVDVSDYSGMLRAIDEAEKKFGPINGVIHTAGLAGGGMIQLKTPDIANKVLTPKVKGTLVLDQVFQDRCPDFVVLCSSLNSIVPYLGQVDYYAANAFLDAFAAYKNGPAGSRTLIVSINWDAWQEVGMAAQLPEEFKNGILPAEGIEAFIRILNNHLNQVVVSTMDIWSVIENALTTLAIFEAQDTGEEIIPQQLAQRPELESAYVAPKSETERLLVNVWQNLLGIEGIGIHDNFFDLGGDSLNIVQLSGRLKKVLDRDITTALLFRYLNIHDFALYLEQEEKGEKPAEQEVQRSEEIEEGRERLMARMNLLESDEE